MSKHWFIAHLIKKVTSEKKNGLDLGVGKDNWNEFKKCKMIGVDRNSQSQSDLILDLEHPLPFKDNFFDVVISINALNYVKKSRQIIDEINRVLKINGVFLCVVDNPRSNNEQEYTWSQMYLDRVLSVSGFKSILSSNPKDYFYAKWYNRTSVYAFAVVQKIKNCQDNFKKRDNKIVHEKQEMKWAKSYNIKTTHPEN